jgi:tetratricopeptide (TPR) repeat protein
MARKKGESAELLAPDPFLETLNKWAGYIQKHHKPLLASVGALFAGIVGFEFFSAQSEHDAAVVTAQLTEAVKAYDEAVDPQKTFTSTKAGAMDAELERARDKLEQVEKDHPGHGAAQLARLYEADVERRLHKYAEAEALFKAYIQAAKPDDNLIFLALEGAGYAAEDQGKLDDALGYFNKLAEGVGGGTFYKDYGLRHKARVLKKKGDDAGAAAALKQLVEMQPPSDLKGPAEEELKTLE